MAVKIAFTGKLRSGKSLLTGYAALFYEFVPFAFGDVLKKDFHDKNPDVPREPKPRASYQSHGQEMRREHGEDIWINRTLEKVRCYESRRALIEDVRQPNEFKRLKDEGYTIIRINASDELRIERARKAGDSFTEADLSHETEKYIDGFEVDYEVTNNGSLEELADQFDEIMRDMGVDEVAVNDDRTPLLR